jgi:hypothetical protein
MNGSLVNAALSIDPEAIRFAQSYVAASDSDAIEFIHPKDIRVSTVMRELLRLSSLISSRKETNSG